MNRTLSFFIALTVFFQSSLCYASQIPDRYGYELLSMATELGCIEKFGSSDEDPQHSAYLIELAPIEEGLSIASNVLQRPVILREMYLASPKAVRILALTSWAHNLAVRNAVGHLAGVKVLGMVSAI